MKPTLFVLAAGMGSRYGGLKQLDGLGPNGETIMDYSIFDAIRGGFGKVVFVIRKDFEADFRTKILSKYENHIPVEVVFQSVDDLPEGFVRPEGRTKPWGTNHAVLMGKAGIREPFAVINADDYYGVDAFKTIYAELSKLAESGEGTMVGYDLCNTVSEHGTVTRGVCHVNEQGMLDRVVETFHLKPCADGKIRDIQEDGDGPVYAPETPVSMNFWGFTPKMLAELWARFPDFYAKEVPQNPQKCEFYLPSVVNAQLQAGTARVRVLPCSEVWYGVTYHEDLASVQAAIARMKAEGRYPEDLWAE